MSTENWNVFEPLNFQNVDNTSQSNIFDETCNVIDPTFSTAVVLDSGDTDLLRECKLDRIEGGEPNHMEGSELDRIEGGDPNHMAGSGLDRIEDVEPDSVIPNINEIENAFSLREIDGDKSFSDHHISSSMVVSSYLNEVPVLNSEQTIVITPVREVIKCEPSLSDDPDSQHVNNYFSHINNANSTEFIDTQCSDVLKVELQECQEVSSKLGNNLTEVNELVTTMFHPDVQKSDSINSVENSLIQTKLKPNLTQQNNNLSQMLLSTKPTKLIAGSAIQKKLSRIDAELIILDDKTIKIQKDIIFQQKKPRGPRQPFPCSVCSKIFTDKWHMKRHEILHTNQKPFSCPACLKGFTRKDKLKSHKCRAPVDVKPPPPCSPNMSDVNQHGIGNNSRQVELLVKTKRPKLLTTTKLKGQTQSGPCPKSYKKACPKSFKNTINSKTAKPVTTKKLMKNKLVGTLKPISTVSKKSFKEEIINLDSSDEETDLRVGDVANDVNYENSDYNNFERHSYTSESQCRDDEDVDPFIMDCESISDENTDLEDCV